MIYLGRLVCALVLVSLNVSTWLKEMVRTDSGTTFGGDSDCALVVISTSVGLLASCADADTAANATRQNANHIAFRGHILEGFIT